MHRDTAAAPLRPKPTLLLSPVQASVAEFSIERSLGTSRERGVRLPAGSRIPL